MHSKVICRFFDDEQMKPDKIRWVRIENRIMMASKKIFMDHHNLTFSFVGEKFFLLFLVEGIINGGVGKLMMPLIQCVRCDLYYHERKLICLTLIKHFPNRGLSKYFRTRLVLRLFVLYFFTLIEYLDHDTSGVDKKQNRRDRDTHTHIQMKYNKLHRHSNRER